MGAVFTIKVIANLFNLSEKRIRQLTSDGIIEEYSKGYYALAPTVQGYIRYLQRQISDDDSGSDYNTEKAKLTKAKRENAELDLKVRTGVLHKSENIEFVMTNMLIAFKAKLLSMPYKILAGINAISDGANRNDAIIGIIKSAVLETLTELSGYNPDMFSDEHILSEQGEEADDNKY